MLLPLPGLGLLGRAVRTLVGRAEPCDVQIRPVEPRVLHPVAQRACRLVRLAPGREDRLRNAGVPQRAVRPGLVRVVARPRRRPLIGRGLPPVLIAVVTVAVLIVTLFAVRAALPPSGLRGCLALRPDLIEMKRVQNTTHARGASPSGAAPLSTARTHHSRRLWPWRWRDAVGLAGRGAARQSARQPRGRRARRARAGSRGVAGLCV